MTLQSISEGSASLALRLARSKRTRASQTLRKKIFLSTENPHSEAESTVLSFSGKSKEKKKVFLGFQPLKRFM
jgi:hypothetical protein